MPENLQSVITESLPEDVNPQSSAEELQKVDMDGTAESSAAAPEEATSTEAEQGKEVPFHEHPRFKEVIDEKNYWKEMAMKLVPVAEQLQKPKVDEPDPYANLSLEEKEFWRKVESVAEKKAMRIADEKTKQFSLEQQVVRQQLAQIAYQKFKETHPDVKAGSPEENAIAVKVRQGYSLDDAYQVVMGPKMLEKYKRESETRKQQKTQQKVAANLESSGLPAQTPVKAGERVSVREFVNRMIAKQEGAA